MPSKRVAVIGAGASGLTAIKCCLDEGLEPVCYEKTSDIGGLWNFRQSAEEDVACVMQSTVINTSKEMMSYSDFPIPADSPNFMHHTYIQKYFNLYAKKFNLRKHIEFNTEVEIIRKAKDFHTTGRWEIKILSSDTKEEKTEIFDAVFLCTGHHAKPHMAKFDGEEDFKGKRLHTHYYREYPTEYAGQRAVVVGMGNSGLDVAVELSRIASQVYVAARRGAWILNRVADNGLPLDIAYTTRAILAFRKRFIGLARHIIQKQLNKRFDHSLYGIRPEHTIDQQHPTINDDLPNRILNGSICMRPNIDRITKTGVEFADGTFEEDIDVIFYATGYTFGFPFLDKDVIDVQDNRVNLYKYIFPPDLGHPTLAVLGCIQPLGAVMPISEMQARLATRVFKGDVSLPSNQQMWDDINATADTMAKQYYASQRHTIQVDYIPYMDELAAMTGCAPQISKLLFSDPKLACKVYFGPCVPYHYRLHGHGKWDGAKKATETVWERMEKPLRTRQGAKSPPENQMWNIFIYFLLPAVILYLLRYLF
ncbi:flavin-containing monooxygenase 5-like [Lineus longissimus]|uniref:flavin-containing monooxygenase 5-like n=1 Tax=Lineus longissimus TaxID=88925 RepID=UPI002B4C489F